MRPAPQSSRWPRIPPTRPQVAVLDVRLPDGNGVEVCREIRSRAPEVACIMLTSFSDDEALSQAVSPGHRAICSSKSAATTSSDAVRRVAAGQSLLDPVLIERVRGQFRKEPEEDERLTRLTSQERRILLHIADGLTNRQIGEAMHLAEKTVKNYVSNLLAKLGMERRTQAAVFAARIDTPSLRDRDS